MREELAVGHGRRKALIRLAATTGASVVLGLSAHFAAGTTPVLACCPGGATVLVSVSASPSTVAAGGSVTVAVHVANSVSDILSVGICYLLPDGQAAPGCQGPQIGPDALPLSLASGSPRDGVWQGIVAVPPAAASGTWTAQFVDVDAGSNGFSQFGPPNPALPGGNFTVVGGTDITPPTIFPPTISPATVGSGGTVTITARITDESGVAAASIQTLPSTTSTIFVPLTFASGTPQDGIWQTDLVPSAPGDYELATVAAQDGAGNFGQIGGFPAFLGSFSVTVKQDQSISFAPLPNKILGEPPFAVAATASSGLPVSFTASGPCSVSGNTVSLSAAGVCTITATQVGNDVFNSAPSVSQSFDVLSTAQFAKGVIDAISGMGLPSGTSESLSSQLRAYVASTARGDQTASCGQLGAFVNYVDAETGKQIPTADAELLLLDSARLTTASACSR